MASGMAVGSSTTIARSDELGDLEIVLAPSQDDGPVAGQRDKEISQIGQNRFRQESYVPELATVDGDRVNEILIRI